MEVLLGIIIAIVVALAVLVCSVIYLIFKSIEFTVQATNLYKKMIERQDRMISLLSDLKDDSKKVVSPDLKTEQPSLPPKLEKSKLKAEEKESAASNSKRPQAASNSSPGNSELTPEEKKWEHYSDY